ncbi:hypothetical protein SynBIOSE41_02526 [Synechococcus sp. BIOS-E4-1]|nr:hypothetical protein SynBIOSE41_02526 [Synechococcus sp. BIOS-E4-1]
MWRYQLLLQQTTPETNHRSTRPPSAAQESIHSNKNSSAKPERIDSFKQMKALASNQQRRTTL